MTAKDVYRGMKVRVDGLDAVVQSMMLTGCFVIYKDQIDKLKIQRVSYKQLEPAEENEN